MSICTVRESNWAICVKIPLKNGTNYFPIPIKLFFCERCTSIASKTETARRDSKLFGSGMLRRFGLLLKMSRT